MTVQSQSLVPVNSPLLLQLREPNNLKMIKNLLPKDIDSTEFLTAAASALVKSPDLLSCTKQSFFLSLLHLAQLGLLPATPLNQAHLVKFGSVCVPIIDYRGYIHLGVTGRTVRQLLAEIVYKNDEFDCHKELTDNGLKTVLKHNWPPFGDRGEMVGCYVVITFPDQTMEPLVHTMSKAEIEKIGKRSKAWSNGPWKTDFDAMAKKTCIKQAFKTVPISNKRLANAIDLDNKIDVEGLAPELKVDTDTGEILPTAPPPSKGNNATKNALREKAESVAPQPPQVPVPPQDDIEDQTGHTPSPDDGFSVDDLEEDEQEEQEEQVEQVVYITPSQEKYLTDLCKHYSFKATDFNKWLGEKFAVGSADKIPASEFEAVKKAVIAMHKVQERR